MSYTFNQSEAQSGDLVPTGDYEATIEKIEKRTLPTSGKEKLSIMYRIRQDVDQPCKNRVVFEDVWAERDHPEFFNRKRLNQLMGTQKIEDGYVFDGISDVIEFLTGANLQIHVAVEFDDYSGKDRNQVKWYRSSKAAPKELGDKKPGSPSPDIEIKDEDLPF